MVRCVLFVVRSVFVLRPRSLCVVCCLLFDVRCVMFASCLLFVVRCSFVRLSLFVFSWCVVCCSLCVVCCSLFVLWFVACWFLSLLFELPCVFCVVCCFFCLL